MVAFIGDGGGHAQGPAAGDARLPLGVIQAVREELRRHGFHAVRWSRRAPNGTKLREFQMSLGHPEGAMRDDGPSAGHMDEATPSRGPHHGILRGRLVGVDGLPIRNSPLVSAYCMALVALLGATYTNYSVGAVIDDQNARKAAQAARDGEARQPSSNQ